MVTYLLSVGYTSFHIAAARTGSVIFELSATWIAPLVMSKIGPIRAGIWFLSWQSLSLAGAGAVFWGIKTGILAATGLVIGTILSRIGLWGFDLSSQIIVQDVSHPLHPTYNLLYITQALSLIIKLGSRTRKPRLILIHRSLMAERFRIVFLRRDCNL